MPPKVSTACRASSSTSSSRVTSVGTTRACPPNFSHSRAASFSARLLRAASTSEAPCLANSWAATRPIPLDAPVITTTAFSTDTGMILLPMNCLVWISCAALQLAGALLGQDPQGWVCRAGLADGREGSALALWRGVRPRRSFQHVHAGGIPRLNVVLLEALLDAAAQFATHPVLPAGQSFHQQQ